MLVVLVVLVALVVLAWLFLAPARRCFGRNDQVRVNPRFFCFRMQRPIVLAFLLTIIGFLWAAAAMMRPF